MADFAAIAKALLAKRGEKGPPPGLAKKPGQLPPGQYKKSLHLPPKGNPKKSPQQFPNRVGPGLGSKNRVV